MKLKIHHWIEFWSKLEGATYNLALKYCGWKLKFVWKHKSYLDPQIKIMARLILL